ncbi:UNVERIFIED_CONTAM: hypothetical protein PYX00_009385 [Menopon gallinae]|uniref:EF-hand domain-containing protein n=1 Tax=Menopon gallinae TaxID=328185 RepID=A0AAW2HBA5_9NEOP
MTKHNIIIRNREESGGREEENGNMEEIEETTHQTRINQDRDTMAKFKITKRQMKELRDAFMVFDKDGDGRITKDELGRVMRSLGQFATEEELQQMLKEIDFDGDGHFSFEEFVQLLLGGDHLGGTLLDNTPADEEKELRDAFRVFDKHNRGFISATDLRAVLQCLGEQLSEEEIEEMIREVDVDGDGRIDFGEFVRALVTSGDEDDDDED